MNIINSKFAYMTNEIHNVIDASKDYELRGFERVSFTYLHKYLIEDRDERGRPHVFPLGIDSSPCNSLF